jgi:endo-alpha-1,4-polygalactosaminidase (GH114 family)
MTPDPVRKQQQRHFLRRLAMAANVVVLTVVVSIAGCGGGRGNGEAPLSTSTPPTQPPPALPNTWTPSVTDTWQWQLRGKVNTRYAARVYDIDLFDSPVELIGQLRREGKAVVCYFSAGSSEDWRPDFKDFQASDLGKPLSGWPGERWLNIRSENVKRIVLARLDLARSKGCDGVEPDNIDAYTNDSGFALSANDQLAYNRWLAREARARGLRVGLKNNVEQIPDLAADFDFAVNEQCHEFRSAQGSECDAYRPFISAGKPVFNAEYLPEYATNEASRARLCSESRSLGIRTLVLPKSLDDQFRLSCD